MDSKTTATNPDALGNAKEGVRWSAWLEPLLKRWEDEEQRWLAASKRDMLTEDFRDRCTAYASVYRRCVDDARAASCGSNVRICDGGPVARPNED